jgi:DNA-binding protein HU-beta
MMNRVQLESTIASRSKVARTVVARIVQELQDIVLESLRAGDKVSLVGFGAFYPRTQKARRGKNPKTGVPVDIPESTKPAFRASKTLIQALNVPKPGASAKAPPPAGGIRELKKALILHEAMQDDERSRKSRKNVRGKKGAPKTGNSRAA